MRYVPGTDLRELFDRGPADPPRVRADRRRDRRPGWTPRTPAGLVHRDVKPAQHPAQRRGRERARLPHGLRADQAARDRRGTSPGRRWVGHARLRRAGADPGPHGRRPRRPLLARLRALRDAHRRVAFPKDSDMAKLWAHITDPPPCRALDRPELVQGFDDVVARATAKEPDERYRDRRRTRRGRAARPSREESAHQAHEAAQPTHASDRALSATPRRFHRRPSPDGRRLAGAGAAGAAASPATSADTPPPPQTPAPPATDAPAAPLPVPAPPRPAAAPVARRPPHCRPSSRGRATALRSR